ncbi:MAG: P-loop NTPase [Planctomycetota bacterium]|jgi:ATP-binding protein involved in chromosome partitioning
MPDLDIHQQLQAALDSFRDPESRRPLSKTGQVTDWVVTDGHARCRLSLTSMFQPIAVEVADRLRDHFIAHVPGLKSVEIVLDTLVRPAQPIGQIGLKAKAVIAVAAGKGGVGKSTLAASIALTLERLGAKTGLMDADVYGPSIPHLLGLDERPGILDGKIQPIRCGSMPVMSMGFLIGRDQAVVWRGPMLHGSITQFLRDTDWGELDYLVIDMPPGTGDVALTLSQLLPLTGAVIVCTPQEVALLDAGKAMAMFEKTKVPILGIVENMSGFTDPETGKSFDIFGRGGARNKSEEMGVPFLGEIPIQIPIRSQSDVGRLAEVLRDPRIAKPFEDVCRALTRSVADQIATRPNVGAPLPVLG